MKDKCNIVDVISRYIKLDHKGSKFWGCCPFHHEKTPSFCIDSAEGFYHCFGCKESGDVISFVQKMESVDFMESVQRLAQSVNMELPQFSHNDENIIKVKKEKEKTLAILKETQDFYFKNLYLPTSKKAQDYIKSRGFTKRELDDFAIGYSKDWNSLVNYLKSKGFSGEEMFLAGVVWKKEGSLSYYDFIGERLIFPTFNSFNECVGFSGRALEKTDFAKYKNTPETQIFKKNQLIFGIHLLKKLKNEKGLKRIILVEGQIDVIAMHRAGFRETCACMGTALTENHARIIKKFCDEVVVCFDGDEAGQKATLRAIDILRQQNINLKIVVLPEKSDPDEILKKEGKEGLENYITNSLSIMDYMILLERSKYNLENAEDKGKFVRNILNILQKYQQGASQEPYLEKIRNLTNIPIDVLRKDLNREGQKSQKEEKNEKIVLTAYENGNIKAEKFVFASILHKKDYVDKKIDYKKLLSDKESLFENISNIENVSILFDVYDVENSPFVKDIIGFNFEEFSNIEKEYFNDCIWMIAEEKLKIQQQKLMKEFVACKDLDERRKINIKMQDIAKMIRNKNLEEFNG